MSVDRPLPDCHYYATALPRLLINLFPESPVLVAPKSLACKIPTRSLGEILVEGQDYRVCRTDFRLVKYWDRTEPTHRFRTVAARNEQKGSERLLGNYRINGKGQLKYRTNEYRTVSGRELLDSKSIPIKVASCWRDRRLPNPYIPRLAKLYPSSPLGSSR